VSNLKLLADAGMESDLNEAFVTYIRSNNEEVKEKISKTIDEYGLRGPMVINCIDNLHRELELRPGLYGFLGQLNNKYRTVTGTELPSNPKKMTRPKVLPDKS
jgi:hypothetical protein